MSSSNTSVRPRVASVLPSASEILAFINGEHLLVGRSHEDNYPASITHLPIITGQKTSYTTAADVDKQVSNALSSGQSLYTVDVETMKKLAPLDVILTQDLCAVCAIDLQTVERVAKQLGPPEPAIVCLNPEDLGGVLDSILTVGDAVGMHDEAVAARQGLLDRIAAVERAVAAAVAGPRRQFNRPAPKVAFIEWPDPIYVGGHWTPQLIEMAGGEHTLNRPPRSKSRGGGGGGGPSFGGGGPSFPVNAEAVVESEPDLIVICPCGLDLEMTRKEAARLEATSWWGELDAVKKGRVALVDGDAMFNRPGPRLVDCLEWLAATILEQPQLAPYGFPVQWLYDDTTTRAPAVVDAAAAAAAKEATPTPPPPPAAPAAKDPGLLEIEEAHKRACLAGQPTYIDPHSGYTVFTQLAALERGRCCGSGCRHCPYDHERVPEKRRKQLKPPIVYVE